MKLSESQDKTERKTTKASDISRQIAFAGIGVVWIFSRQADGSVSVPPALVQVLEFLCGALVLDLMQYVVGGLLWSAFNRHHEKKRNSVNDDPVILAPPWINYPAIFFYLTKIALVLCGFATLLCFLLPI